MPKPGVMWRLSDGSIIETGPVGGEGDLFQKQFDMGQEGDKDTACTDLNTISKNGFDPVKFVQPSEGEYRKSFSAHMKANPGLGVD